MVPIRVLAIYKVPYHQMPVTPNMWCRRAIGRVVNRMISYACAWSDRPSLLEAVRILDTTMGMEKTICN